jgi:micrococcal nuclease
VSRFVSVDLVEWGCAVKVRVLAIVLLLVLGSGASAEVFEARCSAVSDGDTIVVDRGGVRVTVRLVGIDAPEKGQEYADEAAARLAEKVLDKKVTVIYLSADRQGRLLARVSIGGVDVNEALVAEGAAWHVEEQSDDPALAAAHIKARAARLGLWSRGSPEPPWEFRRRAARPVPTPTPIEEAVTLTPRRTSSRPQPTRTSDGTLECFTKIGDNMYRAKNGTVVWTRACSHEPDCEDARVTEGSSPMIYFNRGAACWIINIARR